MLFFETQCSSHAYGTMCRPSVVRLSVMICTVAKWYVVRGQFMHHWIGRW